MLERQASEQLELAVAVEPVMVRTKTASHPSTAMAVLYAASEWMSHQTNTLASLAADESASQCVRRPVRCSQAVELEARGLQSSSQAVQAARKGPVQTEIGQVLLTAVALIAMHPAVGVVEERQSPAGQQRLLVLRQKVTL